MCSNSKNIGANGNTMEQTSEFEKKQNLTGYEVVKEGINTNTGESGATSNNEHATAYVNHSGSGNMVKTEENIHTNGSCMQNKERLWKITAAAQLSQQASFASRLRFEKQSKHIGVKVLCHNMAKAVMQFWNSIEHHLLNDDRNCVDGSVSSLNIDSSEASRDKRSYCEMVLVIYFVLLLSYF
ncbi:hypothetical protein V8G54_019076 [Vigna mungo]|uniref:Uncharacterized protein n=1 Tax=Vigna mungo TaxID=3915 RepID=A0AAQ3N9C3_VIGMU